MGSSSLGDPLDPTLDQHFFHIAIEVPAYRDDDHLGTEPEPRTLSSASDSTGEQRSVVPPLSPALTQRNTDATTAVEASPGIRCWRALKGVLVDRGRALSLVRVAAFPDRRFCRGLDRGRPPGDRGGEVNF